jgi:hypothetical protein
MPTAPRVRLSHSFIATILRKRTFRDVHFISQSTSANVPAATVEGSRQ